MNGDDYLPSGELRCPTCIGPVGDDSRRCERAAEPLHRLHLVAGVYHLPANEVEVRAAAQRWIADRLTSASGRDA